MRALDQARIGGGEEERNDIHGSMCLDDKSWEKFSSVWFRSPSVNKHILKQNRLRSRDIAVAWRSTGDRKKFRKSVACCRRTRVGVTFRI